MSSDPRDGYRSVTSRIVVDDVSSQVDFLRHAFGATGTVDSDRPAEIRIGDSLLMISSTGERQAFPAFLYIYVNDADATFERAIEAGATIIEQPIDTPYGDRRAMVSDPFANQAANSSMPLVPIDPVMSTVLPGLTRWCDGAMVDLATRAQQLLDLHHSGTTLVLPTVWDAWSAHAVVAAGFPALTIGSHPLADSRGQGDNEAMSLDDALDGVRRITAAVDVPVSADMESGYNTAATELVERVLDAGAVGINIEDTVHSEQRLRSAAEHADYIGALRSAADAAGVPLVVNARTDVLLGRTEVFDDPLAEAIRRLRACEEAGARCVYPVRAPDAAAVRTLLDELTGPINVIAHPVNGSTAGSLDDLRAMGVHRVSFGPFLQMTLTESITDLVAPWIH